MGKSKSQISIPGMILNVTHFRDIIVMVDSSRDEWTLNRMMSVRIVIYGE